MTQCVALACALLPLLPRRAGADQRHNGDVLIHALRLFLRQMACAAYLRRLLSGSQFNRPHSSPNVQDAYALRCMPQVHGAVRDVIAYACWAFEIELNAVTDNPLIFIDDATGEIDVISGGKCRL